MGLMTSGDYSLFIKAEGFHLIMNALGKTHIGFRAIHKIEAEMEIPAAIDDMKAVAIRIISLFQTAIIQSRPAGRHGIGDERGNRNEKEQSEKKREPVRSPHLLFIT